MKAYRPSSDYLTDRIPRVHISADDEGVKEIELSDDPYDCMRLNVENVPCIVTLCKVSSRSQTHYNTNTDVLYIHSFGSTNSACSSAGGPPARGGRDSAGEGVLCGEPHHVRHTQGHGHLHKEGGRGQPGPREHLRNDRGESSPPPRPSGLLSSQLKH